jgi:hypothetical protein
MYSIWRKCRVLVSFAALRIPSVLWPMSVWHFVACWIAWCLSLKVSRRWGECVSVNGAIACTSTSETIFPIAALAFPLRHHCLLKRPRLECRRHRTSLLVTWIWIASKCRLIIMISRVVLVRTIHSIHDFLQVERDASTISFIAQRRSEFAKMSIVLSRSANSAHRLEINSMNWW